MTQQNHGHKKLMETYCTGPEQLDAVLAGLSEHQLDLSRAEGKWTIREIVHHIVDTEGFWEAILWAALGHSGCTYNISWLTTGNAYTIPLEYATRPIADSIALFKAFRRYVADMVQRLPNAMERNVLLTQKSDTFQEKVFRVDEMLSWQIQHLENHLKQIRETREIHGI